MMNSKTRTCSGSTWAEQGQPGAQTDQSAQDEQCVSIGNAGLAEAALTDCERVQDAVLEGSASGWTPAASTVGPLTTTDAPVDATNDAAERVQDAVFDQSVSGFGETYATAAEEDAMEVDAEADIPAAGVPPQE